MGCQASAQPATGAEEAASAQLLNSETTTMSPTRSARGSGSSQGDRVKTCSRQIEPGDFVYWPQEDLLDLEVIDVQKGKDDKDTQVVVKVKEKKKVIPYSQSVKLTGPQLHSKDLKNGVQVQFKQPHHDGTGLPGNGVIEGQTNTEVCLKLQDGSRKRQLWISRADIYFLYVMVFSAHSLKNTDKQLLMGMMDKSDPYMKIHLQKSGSADSALQDKESKANHMHKTTTLNNNLDPVWNQDFRFLYCDNVESIRFEVRDSDVLKEDDFLGHAELPKEKWEVKQEEGFWDELTLTDKKGEPMKGEQGKESTIKVHVKLFEPKDRVMDDSQTHPSFCCGCLGN